MTGEHSLRCYVLRSLWPPLVFLAIVTGLWAFVQWAPVYPVRAMCFDGEDGIVYFPIAGALTAEYAEAMQPGMRHVPHFVDGHRMWVSTWEAFAGRGIGRANEVALWAVIEKRTGIAKRQFRTGAARIAGFESDTTPTCAAIQAIATVGGAWARDGPAPIWRRASPGDAAPDYSQEGDLPPVRWGFDPPHQWILLGVILVLGLGLGIYAGGRMLRWKGQTPLQFYRFWGGCLGLVATILAMIVLALTA